MNKKDLKDFVASEANITKKDAGIAIDTVLEGIMSGIEEDGKVTLVGFGTFTVAARKARKARNPQTGEPIDVPAKTVPKFRPSAAMKEMVVDMEVE
jgi:DNA-binding protein HU-beta